jgi:uncharacterized surface protein with fasciclin (FAS1) repeats
MNIAELNQDEVKTVLMQSIHNMERNLAYHVVERDLTQAALEQLTGEEFYHYSETVKQYESEIVFTKKKVELAYAKLWELSE